MSWRSGEVWLEAEVLWFRERAAGPGLARIAPTAVSSSSGRAGRPRRARGGRHGIAVGPDTGLHGQSGVVIPYAGQDFNMHVRFPPPRD